MNKEEFINYIESIGFVSHDFFIEFYEYKGCSIYLYTNWYNFNIGSGLITYKYNDLTPLKQFTRSIKLKELLG